MHDADTFAEFCKNYLTIKPVPVRASCRRLGHATNGRPARLKLTFDTSQAAVELIQASSIMRQSTDILPVM